MLHAVIMAGGAGTRFWPASRVATPKQLLNLAGERSMIQSTVDRLGSLVPPERVLVVTNERLVGAIAHQLPQLPAAAILGEPCKRDTAPCIGLAAFAVSRHDDDAVMAVMPADHVIQQTDVFQRALAFAADLVREQKERIVTFGIPPTYPAETFGYIQRGEHLTTTGDFSSFQVSRFREKPNAQTAAEYLESGDFYWNSGIFIWKAKTILSALKKHESSMHEQLAAIAAAWEQPDFDQVFAQEFAKIDGKSIDYAVMEHAEDVVVVEAPFDWDDVGNWQSLPRLQGVDSEDNTIAGKHLGVDTHGTIVRTSDNHLVVTLGLKDCIVVHTPDATLVADKHQEEAIRQVVEQLKQRGWSDYL
ncbi:MAG: mannose-1-phosphate guanylyltransferase [Planctomycetales bacterium]|nr:mannose-1-phosphate guanylyltransferase [Planctomycetales bacterium]